MAECTTNIATTPAPKPISGCNGCGCGGDGKIGEISKNEGKREVSQLIAGASLFALALVADKAFAQSLPPYAPLAAYAAAYAILGGGILLRALKNVSLGRIFDENFLMSAATIGAFAIGEYPEAAGVMLFYRVGELFLGASVKKSRRSIAGLMDIRPDSANLLREGEIVRAAPQDVAVGDTIVIKPGEKIPLDGLVIGGRSTIDASALTGESIPKSASAGDAVLSGSINLTGALTVEVTAAFGESTASKIIKLVEGAASKKAVAENFITIFARHYTPIVTALALFIALLPPLLIGGEPFKEWINRGLIFLVISCPCALVLSIPMSFFAGIGRAARRGVLVRGGNYLEPLGSLDTVVFDKTGTLTKGVFRVTSIEPAGGFDENTLLELAASAEAHSSHPIATSIIKEFSARRRGDGGDEGEETMRGDLSQYTELAGYGVSIVRNGEIILAGNNLLMAKSGVNINESHTAGTKVYVSIGNAFAGCIVISDEVKPDSKHAISALKSLGVRKTVMLTGDNEREAIAIAAELGIDEAYGGLLPHEKVERIELISAQKRRGGKLAFVGDGINDAPALAVADIGIAMGGAGADAAIEAADIALMTDEPSKIAEAVGIARLTKKIVWQNIAFALGVKAAFLTFGALGAATMWEAVFADVGVSLLAVLNAVRIIRG